MRKRVWFLGFWILITLLLVPPSASAQSQVNCNKCFEECSWWPGLMSICFEAPQGVVGTCQCYERPCRNAGYYCTIIWVTP